MNNSILSFQDRGPWGNNRWRGNCSGWIYHHLFTKIHRPRLFIDPCVGGGTSVEVAKDLDIPAVGLDLHNGFNLLRDSLIEKVGQAADMVISHFPYHNMIEYSGKVWGKTPHPDDLSRCQSVEEFLEKSHVALLNQRDATVPGGFYGTIIGDMRKKGEYFSFQSDFISMMPQRELKAVLIKEQHNVNSNQQEYSRMGMPRIMHEYVLIWQKPADHQGSMLSTLSEMAKQSNGRLQSTWRAVIREALISLGGEASLAELCKQIGGTHGMQKGTWMSHVHQVLTVNPSIFTTSDNDDRWRVAG